MKRLKFLPIIFTLLAGVATITAFAQQSGGQTDPAKSKRANTKPNEPNLAATDSQIAPDPNEALRTAINGLANQMAILSAELRRLREQTERNSETLELLLSEERAAKLDQKIEDMLNQKLALDAREQDLLRRLRNVPQEALLRGGIRREEAEAAVRAELQRAMEDLHAQQESYQKRIADLQTQAERLNKKIETLRKKLEPAEKKESDQ